ncbi:alpha-hydroxy acid oxidase [Muricoccus aerilatus]|uniref:alpha-hydroxy acid oxidase n=1 Tax=Muricoccus aerilatus TaxID=452982 RepID=UPI000A7040F4|nr:alpha-hydroxy acid oxidase [Roseomonas aerilata]
MGLEHCHSIADLRALARRRLPRFAFEYLDGGAEDEVALRRACRSWEEVTLTPRTGVDVARRDPGVTLFGRRWAAPFGISPTGLTGLAWPGADLMIVRAAAARGLPVTLSTPATATIESAAAEAASHLWYQLYVPARLEIAFDLMRRAREADVDVLLVTMDVPVPGKRERDLRNGFSLPFRMTPRLMWDLVTHPAWSFATRRYGEPRFVNLLPYAPPDAQGARSLASFMAGQIMPSLTWDVMRQLRDAWPGHFVVKGVMHPDDAAQCLAIGADGILVSTHGGRQLDAAPAPLDALPAILRAVGGRVPVLIDGGVRRGLDIARALSLGAAFVMAGRPTLYGAGAGGEAGAGRALSILLDELDRAMALLGCQEIARLRVGRNPLPG